MEALGNLLRITGLELALTEALPAASDELRSFLQWSLTDRLYYSVERTGSRLSPQPRWRQLWALNRRHRVTVLGQAAAGVWVPRGTAERVQVAVGDEGTEVLPASTEGLAPDLELLPAAQCPGATVPVVWQGRRVFVSSPGELALVEQSPDQALALRVAARLLHGEQLVDVSGRRPPAHRDPSHEREQQRNRETRRYGALPVPHDGQLRSWRLGVPVGYLAWLGSLGYPESGDTRRPSSSETCTDN